MLCSRRFTIVYILTFIVGCISNTVEHKIHTILRSQAYDEETASLVYELIRDSKISIVIDSREFRVDVIGCESDLPEEEQSHLTDLVALAIANLEGEQVTALLSRYGPLDKIGKVVTISMAHIANRRLPGAMSALCKRALEIDRPWAVDATKLLAIFKDVESIKCLVEVIHKVDKVFSIKKLHLLGIDKKRHYETLRRSAAESLTEMRARESILFLLYRWMIAFNTERTDAVAAGRKDPAYLATRTLVFLSTEIYCMDIISCCFEWLPKYYKGEEPKQVTPPGYDESDLLLSIEGSLIKFDPEAYKRRIVPFKHK